ncbi:prolyl-tRNA synthetase [Limimonas halophila]|uniref:Proline--tRNA ligase n=1 Tax=Limimonas halophila TaxID=1082479 RepID=A0A1G7NA81_9PROT|nr:proline--tRNA ligase [Limimonas halophila]SDF70289.1 prolyl-tRNA synthetase [Limimonas halophila]
MRLSQYFLPTLKETPAEAQVVSHRLMLRAGMIRQASAGIYNWLPLGYAVLKNIERIVREEQDRVGSQEVLMPTIQSADLWRQSGRYEDYGKEMLRIRDRHDREMLYGPTHEEQITEIFKHGAKSYRDVPQNLYQIQWKFRDEIRPRFGVMRGREFLMKDGYSFDIDYESAMRAYRLMFVTYLRTFARMGLQAIPVEAETGPIGGSTSHEFCVLADTGETEIYCPDDLLKFDVLGSVQNSVEDYGQIFDYVTSQYCRTDDRHEPEEFDRMVPAEKQVQRRGIEVGHIFYFGTKYSEPLDATISTRDGETVPVHMGSYGIGVSRVVGAIIEAFHDDSGIVWPEPVAPFTVGLINVKPSDESCTQAAEDLERRLQEAGVSVLHDDTPESAGAKFAQMDLIGLPWQVIVGPKGVKSGHVELKHRATGERQDVSPDSVVGKLAVA